MATTVNPPPNNLYKFTSDGAWSGQWSEVDSFYTADSNFTALKRVAASANACGPDTCYAVGGYRNSRTESGLPNSAIPAAGIVSYNLTSQTWYNDTLVGTVFAGPWDTGEIHFTDIAGSEGILIATGGYVNNAPLSFEYIYLYDIATKAWYQQKTTGAIPSLHRIYYCTVGIRGDNLVNKTYEVTSTHVYPTCVC